MKLLTALYYFYYKLYKRLSVSFGDMAAPAAMFSVGALISVFIVPFIGLFEKLEIIPIFLSQKDNVLIRTIVFSLISLFYFNWNDRYKRIIEQFQQESKVEAKRGTIKIIIFFIVFSIIFSCVALWKSDFYKIHLR